MSLGSFEMLSTKCVYTYTLDIWFINRIDMPYDQNVPAIMHAYKIFIKWGVCVCVYTYITFM